LAAVSLGAHGVDVVTEVCKAIVQFHAVKNPVVRLEPGEELHVVGAMK